MGNNSLCGCSESNLQERQRDEERLAATLQHLIEMYWMGWVEIKSEHLISSEYCGFGFSRNNVAKDATQEVQKKGQRVRWYTFFSFRTGCKIVKIDNE